MIIAGTGHRPNKLGGYSQTSFNILIELAESYIKSNPEITKIISGMALGWDQALAQAAINCNIPFIAAIPCLNQDKMWPTKSKDYYKQLLSKATIISTISMCEYNHLCMQKRNEWMVNQCDLLVALFDGTPGGTMNCVEYARKVDKPIVNLCDNYINLKSK